MNRRGIYEIKALWRKQGRSGEERWRGAECLALKGTVYGVSLALELASEALNGALWMGSYLQGFSFQCY